jgi:tRNA(fMet)-specific endonuclease VapC
LEKKKPTKTDPKKEIKGLGVVFVQVILDTDHLSILQNRNQPDCERLERRLSSHVPNEVAVSVISFQEQTQGWSGWINKAKTDAEILLGYSKLQELLIEFSRMKVLPFGMAAQTTFKELVRQRLRVGTLDLRIASIVLVNQAKLLTRNLKDFRKIPGACEESCVKNAGWV